MPRCIELVPLNQPMVKVNGVFGTPAGGSMIWAPGSTTNCTFVAFTQAEYTDLNARLSAVEASPPKLSIDTASNPERVFDMQAVFYGFLLVLVTVWGLKQLLNLFTGDTDRG